MKYFVRFLAVVMFFCASSICVKQVQGKGKSEPVLSWQPSDFAVVAYKKVSAECTGGGFGIRGFRETDSRLLSDVTETGDWRAQLYEKPARSDFLFSLASAVSGKSVSKSKKWSRSFKLKDYPGGLTFFPNTLKVSMVMKDKTDPANVKFSISASGSDINQKENRPVDGPAPEIKDAKWIDFSVGVDVAFDATAGLLKSYSGSYSGKTGWTGKTEVAGKFSYELDSVSNFESQRALDAKVNSTIKKAIKYLKSNSALWSQNRGDSSIVAYTLLQCGLNADDSSVVLALKQAEESANIQLSGHTYHAAVSILAIEAKYISDEERTMVAAGTSPQSFKRSLSADDKARIEKHLAKMLEGRSNNKLGHWDYGQNAGQNADLSSAQFATLALAACVRCKIAIPAGIVRETATAVMQYQHKTGVDFFPIISISKKGKLKRGKKPVQARGFGYQTPTKGTNQFGAFARTPMAYGSMTTAGICSLLILSDIVQSFDAERLKEEFASEGKGAKTEWLKECQKSITCGMAWTELYYSATHNPNKQSGILDYFYFYLWSLERVGTLTPSKMIGVHDWYNDGSIVLCTKQDDQGSWGYIHETCFALLFLKRATTPLNKPVITGK